MRPRASATEPSFSSSRRTRFTVARDVPAIAAMSSCVSGTTPDSYVRREIDEAPADARLRVDVVGLDDPIRRAPQLLGEQAQEHVLHARVLALQTAKSSRKTDRVSPASSASTVAERRGVRQQERELAEALPRAEHVDEHAVAERREHARAEPPADDEVQRVGRIVAVEHDLAARERPPSGDREQLLTSSAGRSASKRPFHASQSVSRR